MESRFPLQPARFPRAWPQSPRRSCLAPAGPSPHAIPVGVSPLSLQSTGVSFFMDFSLKNPLPINQYLDIQHTWYVLNYRSKTAFTYDKILRYMCKRGLKFSFLYSLNYTFFALTIKNEGRRNSFLRLGKLHTASLVGVGSIIFSICNPLSIRVFRIVDIVR
jgi:hypothetical protein